MLVWGARCEGGGAEVVQTSHGNRSLPYVSDAPVCIGSEGLRERVSLQCVTVLARPQRRHALVARLALVTAQ